MISGSYQNYSCRKGRLPLNVVQRQSGPKCDGSQAICHWRPWLSSHVPLSCLRRRAGLHGVRPPELSFLGPVFTWRQVTQWQCLSLWNHCHNGSKSGSFFPSYCCHLMISFPAKNKPGMIENIFMSHVYYPSEDLVYSTVESEVKNQSWTFTRVYSSSFCLWNLGRLHSDLVLEISKQIGVYFNSLTWRGILGKEMYLLCDMFSFIIRQTTFSSLENA